MGLKSEYINKHIWGIVPGLLIPVVFIWIYLSKFYPADIPVIHIIQRIFPSVLFGKILLLAAMPDLLFVFIFYKQDSFKIASGFLLCAMILVIAAIFMM
jgi:hypothetical protein